jgi:glycosyltransferase involved in cell wall biosynthesis
MKSSPHAPKSAPIPIPLTVALTTYNRLSYLRQAVDSVLRQSYRDFEFLILDNHSTDGTAEYLLGLDDPRIRYVRNAPGSDAAFNACSTLYLARGRRMATLHDDDMMTEELLSTQMAIMDRHPGLAMVWSAPQYIDATGQALNTTPYPSDFLPDERIFAPGEYIQTFMDEGLWPFPSGIMYDTTIFRSQRRVQQVFASFYFKTALPPSMWSTNSNSFDILWPALLNRRHSIGFIPRPLLLYRQHAAQDTRNIDFSRPLVYLYCELKKIARYIPGQPIPAIRFDAYIARFSAQHLLTMNAQPHLSPGKLKKLTASWQALQEEATRDKEAALTLLPLALTISYCTHLPHLAAYRAPSPDNASKAVNRHFAVWVQKRAEGVFLLNSHRQRRIVLFGSVFVAALLILDAQKCGAHIVACIDSNLNRQGQTLLGIPVFPPEWLGEHAGNIDTVILTPEKAHESILTGIVHKWTDKTLEIISWKTLTPIPQTQLNESETS